MSETPDNTDKLWVFDTPKIISVVGGPTEVVRYLREAGVSVTVGAVEQWQRRHLIPAQKLALLLAHDAFDNVATHELIVPAPEGTEAPKGKRGRPKKEAQEDAAPAKAPEPAIEDLF